MSHHRRSWPARWALLLLICLLAACSSKSERLASGLAKAADFVRVANWDKASLEVRNVLQIDPRNAQAYFISGQVDEGKREVQRAFGAYRKALELDPAHTDAKLGLARIYLLANEPQQAEKLAGEVLAADPRSLGARTLQAALLARGGDVAGARQTAQAVLADANSGGGTVSTDASLLLAGLYTNAGDLVAALRVVDQALQAAPENLMLLQVGAEIAGTAKAAPAVAAQAPAYLRRAVAVAPKNNALWATWAMHHARRNEVDAAEAVLRDAVRGQPEDSARRLMLIDLLATRRGPQVAGKAFDEAVAEKPRDTRLRLAHADFLRTVGRSADADRVLTTLVADEGDAPAGLSASNRLASARMAAGQVEEAAALAEAVLRASPRDGAALVTRGRIQLLRGRAQEAVVDLRAALRDQSDSAEVVGLLAQAHRVAGEPQLAREVLGEAVKNNPRVAELRLLLAADLIDSRDFKTAATEIDQVLRNEPTNLRARDLKVALAMAQRDNAGAEKIYQELQALTPQDPLPALRLAQLYTQQRLPEKALKAYDRAASLAPRAPEPAIGAVGLLIAQRRFDAAGQRIERLLAEPGTQVVGQQLKGDLAMARGDLAGAQQHYQKLAELAPALPAGYLNAARAMAARGDSTGALGLLELGEKRNPQTLALPLARAEWLTRLVRFDEAIALYEHLHVRAPQDAVVRNNLAYLLADVRGDRRSLERAAKLLSGLESSNNPSYLHSLGWVRFRLDQPAQALPLLERAAALAPNSPLLQLHLGLALHKSGDRARAETLLRGLIQTQAQLPQIEEARRALNMPPG